ncbi:E3 ubiquitin/ISG15 ligase TRIM25 [Antennarius striatus]|uniref:E3 ubiquitin/ISG15 ligase TRIM25 n=1 Tax=Antennarius striatus TaxID=241820 RepID=UPI0035B4F0FB
MAETTESPFCLRNLEDELTCSICLSPFTCPVTVPCGHNFCLDCLEETWKDLEDYRCPQCRTEFHSKPELKKNTVIGNVVETLSLGSSGTSDARSVEEDSGPDKNDVIVCDTCMQTEASRTCLTCVASYCEEHLRPHLENPVFRLHQLTEPIRDLLERICQDHHKQLEFFCSQHARPICSTCLQQVHKGCTFLSPEEQKTAKEFDLRGKLLLLEGKISKNEDSIFQMKDLQIKLKDSATNRRKALAAEYQQMRDILAQDERDALQEVDRELENGQTKLNDLTKRFTKNISDLRKAKEHIQGLLSQSQTLSFLQVSFDLPPVANFNPYTPRISLDSRKVLAAEASAAALKEHITNILKQPVEARLLTHWPEPKQFQKNKGNPRSHSPGAPPVLQQFCPVPIPTGYFKPVGGWEPYHAQGATATPGPDFATLNPEMYQKPGAQPRRNKKTDEKKTGKSAKNKLSNKHSSSKDCLLDLNEKAGSKEAGSKEKPGLYIPLEVTSAEKRHELLKYAVTLKLDAKTAHKRIMLSEGFTRATVLDEHVNYPDSPSRFAVCSQVLSSTGFSKGRRYWEIKMSSNNFIGIGLSYRSIDRKGATSRLGRNAQSWCVEWFNAKLSAWYNGSETVLPYFNTKRVGVLLDREAGIVTFYNVADRAFPFHSFVFTFAEAVYPAFWMFSSGSSITLCNLEA